MEETKKPFVLCVFCGSSDGSSPIYKEAATRLGVLIAQRGWRLVSLFLVALFVSSFTFTKQVYGGGDLGLMGAVSHAVVENGGHVTGVIPQSLYNVVNKPIGDTVIVDTMHERKMKIYQMSSVFLALPGGLGTLDELFEVLTWQQLGIHNRPVAVLNVDGFFDPILEMISKAKEKGFIRTNENRLKVFASADEVIDGFEDLLARGGIQGNLKWLNTI